MNWLHYQTCMKLDIYSQISTMLTLKFGGGQVILSHMLLGICLLIHAAIKVKLSSQRDHGHRYPGQVGVLLL